MVYYMFIADVTKADEVERLFSETKRLFGKVDIVIANAGIGVGRWKPFIKITEPEFDRVKNHTTNSTPDV
jgi:3-oxoacyl-[acyl-carrier protein] reductase